MKKALFPGSFDPVTLGHIELIARGAAVFDEIVVAVGVNSLKKYLFSEEERVEMVRRSVAHLPNVQVVAFSQLTASLAREAGAAFILRGIRSESDLAYEQPIAFVNHHLNNDLDTVFFLSSPATMHISSSIVREVIKFGGKLEGLVPPAVIDFLTAQQGETNSPFGDTP